MKRLAGMLLAGGCLILVLTGCGGTPPSASGLVSTPTPNLQQTVVAQKTTIAQLQHEASQAHSTNTPTGFGKIMTAVAGTPSPAVKVTAVATTGFGGVMTAVPGTETAEAATSTSTPDIGLAGVSMHAWKGFRSVSLPYEVDLPPGWLLQETKELSGGTKVDIFSVPSNNDKYTSNTLTISEKLSNSWSTLDDYVKAITYPQQQAINQTHQQQLFFKGEWVQTKISNHPARFTYASASLPTENDTNFYAENDAITIVKNKVWTITQSIYSTGRQEAVELSYFSRLLSTLHILQ